MIKLIRTALQCLILIPFMIGFLLVVISISSMNWILDDPKDKEVYNSFS